MSQINFYVIFIAHFQDKYIHKKTLACSLRVFFLLNALFISTVSNVNKDANQHPAD